MFRNSSEIVFVLFLGFDEQRMNWPRGRALGGTTVINYMIHIRGNKVDYDQWEALGNPGWSWKDVFPYFLKSENALLRTKDSGYHSTDGYLNVQDVPFRTRSADVFVAAAQEVGYKYVDYNGEDQLGVSYVQATLRNGSRCSAEKAFLRPIRHRSNLKILIKARVTKILIDPATKRAYGVEYLKNRRYHKAVARKEVILSAGAFNSPQLLMLSGIGPKKHLEDLGIKVLKDLPVGQKLYDHLTFVGLTFKINETIVSRQSDLENPASFVQLALHGNGPMTTLGGVEGLAYIRTNVSTHPSANYPDMELIFVSGHFNTDRGTIYRKIFRLTDNLYETIWKPLENSNTFTMFPMLVHPKSYGHLELKSKNPFHWPKFYGNYLQHPDDIRTFIQGIRIAQRIALSDAFKKYDVEQVTTPLPGCKHLTFDSDPYWECALRYLSSTLHHQVATCKMGPAHDPEAVVDNQLRVYGINNLRVVDTSIIPIPLTAHTNVPAFMVGEKAADLIKAEWSEEHLQPRF